jgi:hypothetical protein
MMEQVLYLPLPWEMSRARRRELAPLVRGCAEPQPTLRLEAASEGCGTV